MLAERVERLVSYLKVMDEVEGWFDVRDGLAFRECLRNQENEGITGDVAEIGVHHGKSFIAIANTARPGEIKYAIDVFDQQTLNIDNSGSGNLSIFKKNVEKFSPDPSKIKAIVMSSLDLAGREHSILTPLRFLSIDGGHTRDITLNDIEIADRILVPGGICCVDDILHHHWTGVISGVFAYLTKRHYFRKVTLVPFALTSKKLYMCRPAYQNMRRKQFSASFKAEKTDIEFGPYTIDFYNPTL